MEQLSERPGFAPPMTLLKPLHGAEPNLEAHLDTFFQQNYPQYEILFCARTADDEGLETARRVAARYPNIPAHFFSTGEPPYINAKVASLELMESAAAYDILVISDSDVRVTSDYLRAVALPFADEKVGAVTCPYRGVAAEGGLWARLEAVGMSVEMTSGVLAARAMEGMQFTLGPTMAFRRETIRRMGGFRVTADYCADDFVLGNETWKGGQQVVLSHHAIDHMVINKTLAASLKHQVRWMKSTRFSRPRGHLGTALTFSMPFGLLGWAVAARPRAYWLGPGNAARTIACCRPRGCWRSKLVWPTSSLSNARFDGFLFLDRKLFLEPDTLARSRIPVTSRRKNARSKISMSCAADATSAAGPSKASCRRSIAPAPVALQEVVPPSIDSCPARKAICARQFPTPSTTGRR
jgi:ceramide glucosyltransferase